MGIIPLYELCSRSQAAATNQHTNAQRRGEFCFIESGVFDLYSDTIPTLRTATQKAVSNARTTKNGAQEPIIGGGVCSWSRKNLSLAAKGRFFNGTAQNFIAKPAKNCKIPRFLAFFGWNRRISTRKRASSQTSPAGGDPVQRYKQPLQNGAICTFPQGVKLGLPTCGRFRHRPSGVRGQRTLQAVSSLLLALLAMKKSKKKPNTQRGAHSWAGFPPARRWPSHLPQKPKKATTKDRKRTSRPPPKDD